MNGGPLPENPYLSYVPHDSFDARGVLKPEAYEARDQVPRNLVVSKEELERRKQQVINTQKISINPAMVGFTEFSPISAPFS